jgi:penicillin-binding protein 1A
MLRRKRRNTGLAIFILTIETCVAAVLVVGLAWFWHFSSQLPNVDNLSLASGGQNPTTIVSEDGVVLGTLDVQNREPVQLDQVSKVAMDATVAVEDHRFWEHHGVDLLGIGRSVYANLRHDNMTSQGGSTLTQQLVRSLNQFGLSRDKKYARKVREALTAIRVEQEYSKQEILQLYLNTIYYGSGAYGIQAAAKTYFGIPASQLSLSEAALLAGIPQRPAAFCPYDHLDASINRRNEVLANMREYGYITAQQEAAARAEEPSLKPRRAKKTMDFKAPYFVTYVLRDLSERYGPDFIYSGLRIETTLNWQMQQLAEKTLETGIQHEASQYHTNQGALVSIDPKTGYIRAMVGGRNFHTDQYNAVTQGRRQPGSSFKLFDYAAAFDSGECTLDSSFEDRPIPYPHDPKHRVVHNYEGGYTYRDVSCLTAIAKSLNTVAVQVAAKVGIHNVIKYAHAMGITSKLDPYLPTALGASAVRPLDLCSAYTVITNRGSRYKPMAIVRVVDADGVVEEHTPDEQSNIIKPEAADMMDKAFEAVVTYGTGTLARGSQEAGIVDGARGKTGTTSDHRDAWFAGYTKDLATVIWVASVHKGKGGRKLYLPLGEGTGGVLCAPIWHDYMYKAVPIQQKFRLNTEVVMAESPKPADVPHPERREKPVHKRTHTLVQAAATTDDTPPTDPDAAMASTDDNAPQTADPAQPGGDSGNPSTDTTSPGNQDNSDQSGNTDSGAQDNASDKPDRAVTHIAAAPARVRTAEPPARLATPPEQRMVTVTVCVDSGQLATPWCTETQQVRVTARRAARMRHCRIHRPPPGEQ